MDRMGGEQGNDQGQKQGVNLTEQPLQEGEKQLQVDHIQ